MKKLLLSAALGGFLFLGTGCATPGFNGGWPTIVYPDVPNNGEAANKILRDMNYDMKEAADDFNHIMMLEPAMHLTKWNVR